MATTVNLDALIPREDMAVEPSSSAGSLRHNISISDLESTGFVKHALRKPDFQRETTSWKPEAVVDLIHAFLQGDLIPAVILWSSGNHQFVIDGAHRLSALIAWVHNDYGDGEASTRLFLDGLTDEQKRIGDRTRRLVEKDIGRYAHLKGMLGQASHGSDEERRLAMLSQNSIAIQWVTATTTVAAQASFFKINQAAQPIDQIERRILQSRWAPNSIASRAIARGGAGHKYWERFELEIGRLVEEKAAKIHEILFKPSHTHPITSNDVPVAGQGYNALPFVFNLVSACNSLQLPNNSKTQTIENPLDEDTDGSQTLSMLVRVEEDLKLITTNDAGSIGFHPLIYFYAQSGTFLPYAFLAALLFAKELDKKGKKKEFTKIRADFEDFLRTNKQVITLTISKFGSGNKSLRALIDLYWRLFHIFKKSEQKEAPIVLEQLTSEERFEFLKQLEIRAKRSTSAAPTRGSKSASFINSSLEQAHKCSICGGFLHSNAITFDHIIKKAEGGTGSSENLSPVHPFCNSGVKN